MNKKIIQAMVMSLVIGMNQSVLAEDQGRLINWNEKVQATLEQRIDHNLDVEMKMVNAGQEQMTAIALQKEQQESSSGVALTGIWLSNPQLGL